MVARSAEHVIAGIAFPEGLGWSADERALYCTGVQDASVWRIVGDEPALERIANLGGGTNNLVLASDGGCLVAQNGGVDSNPSMLATFPEMEPGPAIRPTSPGLVHVARDGNARYMLDAGVNAPNDVAVAGDGTLFFTDPGNPFLPERVTPRVMRLSPAGDLDVVAEGFGYCNGIVAEDESVLVTDHGGVVRVGFDGSRQWVARYEGGIDGLALDVEGRIYVAGQQDGVIRVFEADTQMDELHVTERGSVTNCCFGGSDLRDLYVADALAGAVSVFPALPTPGREVDVWPAV